MTRRVPNLSWLLPVGATKCNKFGFAPPTPSNLLHLLPVSATNCNKFGFGRSPSGRCGPLPAAIGAHLVPAAADPHVAPRAGVVLRLVVEPPLTGVVPTGLEAGPRAVPHRRRHPHDDLGL